MTDNGYVTWTSADGKSGGGAGSIVEPESLRVGPGAYYIGGLGIVSAADYTNWLLERRLGAIEQKLNELLKRPQDSA